MTISLSDILRLFCNAWTYFPGILWFSRWKGRSYCGNDSYRYRPSDLCFLRVLVFAIVLAATKYVSVGSICAAIAYPVFTPIVQLFIIKGDGVLANTLMATAIGLLIIYMHRPNIKRLMNGSENKFGSKKKA